MKNDDLFEIIGDISDRHIVAAKKTKKQAVWKKWTALAACLCVVVAAAFRVTLRLPSGYEDSGKEPDYVQDDYPIDNGINNLGASETSDKYSNLSQLLEDVSKNDNHGEAMDSNGGRSLSSAGDSVICGTKAVAYNGYVYRIGDECVEILNFDGTVEGAIDFAAHEMFISGDRLALLGGRTEGNELEYESYSIVRTYMLRDPANPEFMEKYEQSGERVACYMANDKLYLLTTDGVCACGYSRLDDVSGYVPTFDGEPWNQSEITILGEPTSVNYLAVSAVEMQGGISAMRAFYGDIDNVFYGEDWLGIAVQTVSEEKQTQPDVYTFDKNLTFTGKLDFAEITGVEKNIECDEKGTVIGSRIDVTAVFKTGDTFGFVGKYICSQADETGNSYTTKIMVAAKDMATNKESFEFLDMQADGFDIHDIFFEDNKAIICVSTLYDIDDPNAMSEGNRIVVAEFEAGKITTHLADFITDSVNGIEDYFAYGSPYGSLKTLIPLQDGKYLRYNRLPNGFDIFDFSDPSAPKLLYKSEGEISDNERFDFIWHKFDDNVFGVMHINIGDTGEIRNAEFSYRIYSVDSYTEEPLTLLNEYVFGSSFSSSTLGFEVFEYGGEYYFVTRDSDTVTRIEF